jgi:hypothetical protein
MIFEIDPPHDEVIALNWEIDARSMRCDKHNENADLKDSSEGGRDNAQKPRLLINACCREFVDQIIEKCYEVQEVRGGG